MSIPDDVKSYRDVRNTDTVVRHYSVPGNGFLYAYRDGDEHVVVSRGDEPNTRWVKRVPATRESVEQGDTLWTIPENFEKIIHWSREMIAYGIYEIPEIDTHALISIPTNDWLVDAWYQVKKLGEITASPVGTLGSETAIRDVAADERDEGDNDIAVVLEQIADAHSDLEYDLEMCCEWVITGGIDQERMPDQPLRLSDNQQISFRMQVFRPQEFLEGELDVDSEKLSIAVRRLNDEGLLPSRYNFEIDIDTDQ